MNKLFITFPIIELSIILFGCSTMPKGAVTVNNLDKGKYLGKWFEIARFDFTFERNLNNTTAEYTLLENGFIGVTNRGYNYKKKKWEEAEGKARFRGADTVGELKVSFFGPFYGSYNIIAIDDDYQYALIAGSSTKYLWLLSREKTIPDKIKDEYLCIAESLGYDTDKLIWVEHNK
jgi:apolipoprotein D and lipocalin family protein